MKVVDGKKISAKSGRPYGRPQNEISDFAKYFELQKTGVMTVPECCAALGISKGTWYNRVRAVC